MCFKVNTMDGKNKFSIFLGTLTPTELKQWLDNPTNMKMLWSMAKRTVNDLPAPRNLEELEYFLTSMGRIVSQKVALLKSLAAGEHPDVAANLQALGHNPDKGRVHHSEI